METNLHTARDGVKRRLPKRRREQDKYDFCLLLIEQLNELV